MPRRAATANFFTFVAGLNTESGPLTFPENASLDEENFDLSRDGSRARRLGVDYENGYVDNALFNVNEQQNGRVNTFSWKGVAGDAATEFLVVQIGSTLYFHDQTSAAGGAISANAKAFTVNLATFTAPISTVAGTEIVQFTTGRGRLFVTSPNLNPFYITYDPVGDSISTTTIKIEVRDLIGVDEISAVDNRPVTLSTDHEYNLKNQGWDATRYNAMFSSQAVYPSNADIWHVAKSNNGVAADPEIFDPTVLVEQNFGTTPAPKGRFIYDYFLDNRDAASGVAITVDPVQTRPTAITFFSGRAFYSFGSTVFFSQTVTDIDKVGLCYQEADPTSEHIFDLIATDGGTIEIPDAADIKALVSTKDYVLAFANNGVWQIKGIDGKFTATDFQVNRVTDIGVESPLNIADLEGQPIYFAKSGIYQLQDDGTGVLATENLTQDSIQTFYLSIPAAARRNGQAVYDATARKLYWFYDSDTNATGVQFRDRKTAVLVLDTSLPAFSKYTLPVLDSTAGPSAYSAFVTSDFRTVELEDDVIMPNGDQVVVTNLDDVFINITGPAPDPTGLAMVSIALSAGANYNYTVAEFNNRSFTDWETELGTGIDYLSFLETGYFIGGDAIRNKQATYLNTFLTRTEENYITSTTFDEPSACTVQARWEWTSTDESHRWTPKQNCYRFVPPIPAGTPSTPIDYSYDVIRNKLKIRGKGKALHLRFESEAGKDCRILGWSIPVTIEGAA